MKGFTLIEILLAIAIIAILVGIGMPALRTIQQETLLKSADGTVKTLTDAKTRAMIEGQDNPVLHGNDVNAAISYLVSGGYLQQKQSL